MDKVIFPKTKLYEYLLSMDNNEKVIIQKIDDKWQIIITIVKEFELE